MKQKFFYVLLINIILLSSLGWSGKFSRTASMQAGGAEPTLPSRPAPAPREESRSTLPKVKVSIDANPKEARVGEEVLFTILISSPGLQKSSGINVWGLIPEAFDVVEVSTSQGTVKFNPAAYRTRAMLSTLRGNVPAKITIKTRVNEGTGIGRMYYSAARVWCGEPGGRGVFSNWVGVEITG